MQYMKGLCFSDASTSYNVTDTKFANDTDHASAEAHEQVLPVPPRGPAHSLRDNYIQI